MSARRALVFAALGLAIQLLAHFGLLGMLPPEARVGLAFAALVLLPGHALLTAIGELPPGGLWLSSGWALGLGVAWLGAQVLATRALHLPFTVLALASAAPNALLWIGAALRGPRHDEPRDPALNRLALVFVLLATILACLHCSHLGTPVSYYSDSPDHVGTIRRMIASGDAFPKDAFFRDAGSAGADPRKGLWHSCVALIATLANVDPLPAWRMLAGLIAPLFVLNAASFAFLIGGGAAAAVGAWALLLTYGGSLGAQYLREAVFATKLADQLALAVAAAVLADLERRSARSRAVVIGLALGAVATHVFASLQFAIVFGALAAGLAVRERGAGPRFRRLLLTSLAMGAACLPYLLWRAHAAYSPGNVIHTEPQGLLTLWNGARVVSIGVLWDWLGGTWPLIPLSWWAWARASERPAVLYLLTTSLAVAVLLFFPPLVGILQPRLGYLLMRFVWLIPMSGAFAFAVPSLVRGAARRRPLAIAGLAGLVLLAAPVIGDGWRTLIHWRRTVREDATISIERWQPALEWMDRNLPAGSVVLSDPATSYSIPMMTRHWVATLVDQHSSPNDPEALTRILDARDALDPFSPWSRTREVVKRRGVTAIALNNRFSEVPRLNYWAPNPAWFASARARLDARPDAFLRVYDTGDFAVYRIRPEVLDTLADGGRTRPFVSPYRPEAAAGERTMGEGLPSLLGFRLGTRQAWPGDTVAVVIDWHAAGSLPPGSYDIAVRFDRDQTPGPHPPAWFAKPVRKVVERLHHERYRFRWDHLPTDGEYGVDLWQPNEVVRDSFAAPVPPDVAPGEYQVQVRIVRQPHYPNYRLSDYFFDHDYYAGVPAGTLTIARGVRAR